MRAASIRTRFVRFAATGIAAMALHTLVFLVLVEAARLRPVLAAMLAFLAALGLSYAGNRRWTFRSAAPAGPQVLKFSVVAAVGFALNVAVTYVTVDVLALSYWYALALVVATVPAASFAANHLWVFGLPGTPT
jgi:putative flippase GtrA